MVSLLTALSFDLQHLVSFLSYLSWYLIEHLLQLSASCFQSQCLWVSGPSCRCPWNIVQVAYRTVSHVQFTIHDVLWYMPVIHSMCITQPLKTMLEEERIHSPGFCWFQHSRFGNFFFPCNAKDMQGKWKLYRHFLHKLDTHCWKSMLWKQLFILSFYPIL